MEHKTITIVSGLGNDLQAWTFQIEEKDLVNLMLKYEDKGCSVLGDAQDIAEEIKDIYK